MAGLIAWDGEAGGPATAAPGLDPYVLTVGAVDADGAVPAWSGHGHNFAGGPSRTWWRRASGCAPGSTVNLLSNCHKYSPPDQEVRLRVWRDGGWAMAAVADRQRPLARLDLHRAAAAGLRPRGRRGHRRRRARPPRRHPAAKDRGPAPRRPLCRCS
jgi:hypothetical protein